MKIKTSITWWVLSRVEKSLRWADDVFDSDWLLLFVWDNCDADDEVRIDWDCIDEDEELIGGGGVLLGVWCLFKIGVCVKLFEFVFWFKFTFNRNDFNKKR